ncbi:MAG: hypothetical protein ACLPLR_04780 [Terriglobales bacterium]
MRNSALVLVACCLFASSAVAQKDAPALPTVTSFECPDIPPSGQEGRARIQGVVKMQVTTDGHHAADIKLISGHPMLAKFVTANIRTWKFADHHPTTFAVTYFFVTEGEFKYDPVTKCSAKMELPTKVTINTSF